MEDRDAEDKYRESNGKLALLEALAFWFALGGSITWLPALSHNIDKHAGLQTMYTSWLSWFALLLSISFIYVHSNWFTRVLFGGNFLIWLGSVGWVWYKVGL